jgi:hypothetical protein
MAEVSQSPFDFQDPKDAQTDEDIYREARDFLKLVIDAESDNRNNAIIALNFRDGDQWPADLVQSRGTGRLQMTINHTDTMVTRVENNLKQQRPRIKAHPVGDGADLDKAKLVNGIVRHIENISKASIAYDRGGASALDIGWGYWRIKGDYISPDSFDQELKILMIDNTFTVYRDPGSILPDGSDSKRYVISTKEKRVKYKQEHPEAKGIDFNAEGSGADDLEWETKDEIRLAEYFRIVEKPERLFKMVDGSTKFESTFAPGVLSKALKDPETHAFAMETVDGKRVPVERKSSKPQVQWFKLDGRKVVDRRDLPGQFIPIIAVEGNNKNINGRRRRSGMIKNMIEPAQGVNYWETMKTERLALTPKSSWVAYEGVIEGHPEWHTANNANHSVLVGKAVTGPDGQLLPLPIRQQPAGLEAGMSEASQTAEHNLMAIAGMPHEPGQDSKGEVVSGEAIRQRRGLADDAHYQYYDNQTLSIAFTGRILLDLIPYYYDTPRQQRIIEEDGAPSMVGINQPQANPDGTITKKNDLTIGLYDVVMDTGPGYDSKREEGAEAMTALMGTPMGEVVAKAAPDIVMRSFDFPYADKIADRLTATIPQAMQDAIKELPDQAQAIIQSLQGQVQALTQHTQALEADLKYGLTKTLHQEATKLQVEHLHDKRAEADTHTDAFTKIEDTHTRAQTALNVAEIQAGATLLNTHAEAAHNKEAAKELTKSAEKAEKANGAGS